jgi:pimeloyl-ACP methyl ester carboxylesterase
MAPGVNGDDLHYEVFGDGPALVLGYPFGGPGLATVDSLPQAFLERLTDTFRVIVVDYPRGVGHSAPPAPDVMTADNVCTELLDIATAAGADTFAYWGYSWGGVVGLQLACRTDRLSALVVGGWPPIDAPYDDIRAMTTHAAADPSLPQEYRSLVQGWETFYGSLVHWDETAVADITCPRLCYVGGDDVVVQHGVSVRLSDLVEARTSDLHRLGWTVEVIPGLDHEGAMTTAHTITPAVRAFLESALLQGAVR